MRISRGRIAPMLIIGEIMKYNIRIVEDDAYMLTIEVNGRGYVRNKQLGYWYGVEEDDIVELDKDLIEAIYQKIDHIEDAIEDNPSYVYHP